MKRFVVVEVPDEALEGVVAWIQAQNLVYEIKLVDESGEELGEDD